MAITVSHYTIRLEIRADGATWEETSLYGLSDAEAVDLVKSGGNIAPGDVEQLDPDIHNLEGLRADGTVHIFRSGEDRHFWPED